MLLSVTFPTWVLSALTTAETPRTSERRNFWQGGARFAHAGGKVDRAHPSSVVMLRREQAAEVHVMSISKGRREREGGGENAAHDALCLGNKFMKRS